MGITKAVKFYNRFHERKESWVVDFMTQSRYQFLRGLLQDQRGKILVVGCGSKDEMSILNDQCDGAGLDISRKAIEKSKERYPRFRYIVADAMNLPFDNGRFDCVVCSEVIEHLPDDDKFLKEAKRVLKPSGRLVITTPNWLSWYGLARKVGEFLFKRPFTSGDQPIDHWYTYWSLKRKANQYFTISTKWGLWFFPPFGKGQYMIPDLVIYPLVKVLNPLNISMRNIFPIFGHCLVFDLKKKS